MYSDIKLVTSASASIDWNAFKSWENSGVQLAFNFLVLAAIVSDFIWILNSGITISVAEAAFGIENVPAVLSS